MTIIPPPDRPPIDYPALERVSREARRFISRHGEHGCLVGCPKETSPEWLDIKARLTAELWPTYDRPGQLQLFAAGGAP